MGVTGIVIVDRIIFGHIILPTLISNVPCTSTNITQKVV